MHEQVSSLSSVESLYATHMYIVIILFTVTTVSLWCCDRVLDGRHGGCQSVGSHCSNGLLYYYYTLFIIVHHSVLVCYHPPSVGPCLCCVVSRFVTSSRWLVRDWSIAGLCVSIIKMTVIIIIYHAIFLLPEVEEKASLLPRAAIPRLATGRASAV